MGETAVKRTHHEYLTRAKTAADKEGRYEEISAGARARFIRAHMQIDTMFDQLSKGARA
jgi:hypothetical protein